VASCRVGQSAGPFQRVVRARPNHPAPEAVGASLLLVHGAVTLLQVMCRCCSGLSKTGVWQQCMQNMGVVWWDGNVGGTEPCAA
jgi:hypothetical protein